MSNPTTAPEWNHLQLLQEKMSNQRLTHLFDKNQQRFQQFSLQVGDIFVDYSKNFIDSEVLEGLLSLARSQHLGESITNLWQGKPLSPQVGAVPYLALRDRSCLPLCIEGEDISSTIRNGLFVMRRISDAVRSWQWRGYNGKPITDVVTVGVGGSGNAAEMVCRALAPLQSTNLKSHFIANADNEAMQQKLAQLHADSTLFIVSSKSFTTQETLQNARMAKAWLLGHVNTASALHQHFVALTSNRQAAQAFGIHDDNIVPLWDWLPGRYAFWSTGGLPIALALGMDRFEQLLSGAQLMDHHFVNAPLRLNLPVIYGLLGVWYSSFWHLSSHVVLPYSERMELLPGFLQHSLTETTGKSVDLDGNRLDYNTCPVIWGSAGTKHQHTYFQLLHQGTQMVPADFIAIANDATASVDTTPTFYHVLSQTEALMRGFSSSADQTFEEMQQCMPGNKPSTSVLLADLTPSALGQLLALYENAAFVQSIIWNINPFSHWGTELGKRLVTALNDSGEPFATGIHDSSTVGLLQTFRRMQAERHQRSLYGNCSPIDESIYSVF